MNDQYDDYGEEEVSPRERAQLMAEAFLGEGAEALDKPVSITLPIAQEGETYQNGAQVAGAGVWKYHVIAVRKREGNEALLIADSQGITKVIPREKLCEQWDQYESCLQSRVIHKNTVDTFHITLEDLFGHDILVPRTIRFEQEKKPSLIGCIVDVCSSVYRQIIKRKKE